MSETEVTYKDILSKLPTAVSCRFAGENPSNDLVDAQMEVRIQDDGSVVVEATVKMKNPDDYLESVTITNSLDSNTLSRFVTNTLYFPTDGQRISAYQTELVDGKWAEKDRGKTYYAIVTGIFKNDRYFVFDKKYMYPK